LIIFQVNWSGIRNQHSTNAFVEDMYDRLKEMMDEYEVIIFRWPEYIHHLEKVCPTRVFISWLSCFILFYFWLSQVLFVDQLWKGRCKLEVLKDICFPFSLIFKSKLEVACTYMCFCILIKGYSRY
jgi:hypothetical protein